MRLISARLQRVRQHGLLELDFGRGFTLIGGANEAGKSTVVEALHKALFLKATATGRGVEELRSQLHSGLPEVELAFECGGQPWRLRKRFSGASGTCQLSSSSGVNLQGSSAEARLAELLRVSGPVEGRRIAQLPLRWAHLWVRQGEAGSDLLAQGADAYDLPRLVQQLQQGPAAEARNAAAQALESPLDQQVQLVLQQRLEQQFTATGKVRAGSPLAVAIAREGDAQDALREAEARLAALEAAMEQLRQINARLLAIEPLRQQLAAAEPLQRQRQSLQHLLNQQRALEQQRQADQRQLLQIEHALQQAQQALQSRKASLETAETQRQQLQQSLQRLTLLRDLAAVERERVQLQQHKAHFDALQQQASGVKAQLAQLPVVTTDQVRQLRQAEAQLAQLQARCQGMATTVELLDADQTVQLAGQTLAVGRSVQLEQAAVLQVGPGTRLQISPGGGAAMAEAASQRQQAEARLQGLQQSLGLDDSETAERLAQQRQALESELNNLRKSAATIPWAQLDQQLGALQPRRRRLDAALAALGPAPPGWSEPLPEELEQREASLRAELHRLEQELTGGQQQRETLNQQLQRQQGEAGRLGGAIATTTSQLEQLLAQHGDSAELADQLTHLDNALKATGAGDDAAEQLARLQAEKETLLSQRGQQEQICRSLGALDPSAEVEQLQAAWDQAREERQAIERTTTALQLLQRAFHGAQQQAASHYCIPLQMALGGYLQALAPSSGAEALLAFDPQQGFADLRLQRSRATFDFGQLSGGMREQLGAALRLALAEVLLGAYDGCLPLVFDDAFSNSDPERLEGVQRMLRRGVDQGQQILLFSCTPDAFAGLLQAPASARIDLPAATV